MDILFSLMMDGMDHKAEMMAGGLAVEVVVVETMEEAVVEVSNSFL